MKQGHTRRRRAWGAGLVALLALTAGWGTPAAAQSGADTSACPWMDTSLPAKARARMIVSHMTLEQQASLMKVSPGSGAYAGYQVLTPPIPSLCLPAIIQGDGPKGPIFSRTGVTDFPSPITLTATFNPSLARQYGEAVGSEFRGKGVSMVHAPTANLARVPEWGRNWESLGEDTYLATQIDNENIKGIQSNGLIADVKHIAEYNQEKHTHPASFKPGEVPNNVLIDNRTMQETELSIFASAVRNANVRAMMCSFTVINSAPACQSPQIMGWLRKSVGFDGMVRSDRPTTVTNLAQAINQGMDQSFDFTPAQILALVNDGLVTPEQIATAAYHIVLPAFEFGIVDRPWTNTSSAEVTTPRNRAIALRVAQEGTVLLRNKRSVLPLGGPRRRSIAVIGSDASTAPVTGPCYCAFGLNLPPSPRLVTPLSAISERAAKDGISVSYSEGDRTGDPTKDADDIAAAAAAAKQASVAIVFAGLNAGEGADLSSATLAGDGQRSDRDQLIQAVAAANSNTIVVLHTANPVLMPWNDNVAAVVQAGYPGEVSGPAISSVLFGDVNPSGKLPVTIPAQASQSLSANPARYPGVNGTQLYSEGLNIGYKWYNANHFKPLYPFGYGLSYTSFAFSKLRVHNATLRSQRIDPNGSPDDVVATVEATVTNTGDQTGKEIAQLYLTHPAAADEPVRQLRGVQPVTLKPRERTTVSFELTARDLAYYSDVDNRWHVAPGSYGLSVGNSSAVADLPLRDTLSVR